MSRGISPGGGQGGLPPGGEHGDSPRERNKGDSLREGDIGRRRPGGWGSATGHVVVVVVGTRNATTGPGAGYMLSALARWVPAP
eukprot:6739656-Pyramimonas_sp.AAC.1